jgi:hypothetical protein
LADIPRVPGVSNLAHANSPACQLVKLWQTTPQTPHKRSIFSIDLEKEVGCVDLNLIPRNAEVRETGVVSRNDAHQGEFGFQ